jgi:hypothetical protein
MATAPAALQPQLPAIASKTQVKLIAPVVVAYDRDTRKVTCQAQAQFQLPAGVTIPTANPHTITQQVSFSSEPNADDSGRRFQLFDADHLAVAIGVARQPSEPTPQLQTARTTQSNTAIVPPTAQQKRAPAIGVARLPGAPTPQLRIARTAPSDTAVVPAAAQQRLATAGPAGLPPIAPAAPAEPRSSTRTSQTPPQSPDLATPTEPPARFEGPAPPSGQGPLPPAESNYPAQTTRVFIHIADPGQLAAADRLRRSIATYRLGGTPLAIPPVRFVPRTPPRPEIRCLKADDCPTAERLADQLEADLGERPAVVDLHRAFQNDPRIRRGSLELWLPSN